MKSQITSDKSQTKSKFQFRKQNEMAQSGKPYDLEERTFLFAKEVAIFCRKLPTNLSNVEYEKQIIRSSGSVGANYIEANESLGKKDFFLSFVYLIIGILPDISITLLVPMYLNGGAAAAHYINSITLVDGRRYSGKFLIKTNSEVKRVVQIRISGRVVKKNYKTGKLLGFLQTMISRLRIFEI